MLKGRSDVQLKIIKKPWFIPIVLTILILIIGNIYTNHLVPKAETLPEDEIRSQLEHMYGGKVERLSLKGSMYEVELSLSNAAYLARSGCRDWESAVSFPDKRNRCGRNADCFC